MIAITVQELMDYTDWQRAQWRTWLAGPGEGSLALTAGPHGDGRFGTVGDLVKHIFSAETRYVDRLRDRTPSDLTAIPTDNIEALFDCGARGRVELEYLLLDFPENEWEREREFQILTFTVRATPRKIVMHILMHEIRHWAQIATILRFHGKPMGEFHDLIAAPVLGGGFVAA